MADGDSGEARARAPPVTGHQGLINSNPYGGWIFRVRVESPSEDLLDSAAYAALGERGDSHGD